MKRPVYRMKAGGVDCWRVGRTPKVMISSLVALQTWWEEFALSEGFERRSVDGFRRRFDGDCRRLGSPRWPGFRKAAGSRCWNLD